MASALDSEVKEAGPLGNLNFLLWSLFVICLIAFSIVPIKNHFHHMADVSSSSNKDYPMWFAKGQEVLHGQSPYPSDPAKSFDFMYPPSFSGILALLSMPGQLGFVALLVFFCSAAWVGCLWICRWVASAAGPLDILAYAIPNCIVVGYAWGIYLLGQPIIFLLLCMLLALVCVLKKRQWSAGALIALAAAIKAFPILALGWFIFRRQWKAVASCILWLGVLLLILPALFRGPSGALDDLRTWTRGTFKYDEKGIAQRATRGDTWRNGSLISVVNRLLRVKIAENEPQVPANGSSESPVPDDGKRITTTFPGADGPPLYVNFTHASFRTVNLVIGILTVAICAVFLLSVPRNRDRTMQTDAVEYSMMLLLVIIFTPLSFTYLNFWVLFPLVLTMQFMMDPRWPVGPRRLLLAGFLAFVVLTLLSIPLLPVFHILRAMGNTLAANVLLLVMMAYQLQFWRSAGTPRLRGASFSREISDPAPRLA